MRFINRSLKVVEPSGRKEVSRKIRRGEGKARAFSGSAGAVNDEKKNYSGLMMIFFAMMAVLGLVAIGSDFLNPYYTVGIPCLIVWVLSSFKRGTTVARSWSVKISLGAIVILLVVKGLQSL